MQSKDQSAKIVVGNYMFRYIFAALGAGIIVPAIQAIGVGWFSTISTLFLVVSGGCVWITTIFGDKWRDQVDARNQRRAARQGESVGTTN